MNREEVLAKSRSEAKDEGFMQAENRGRKFGITILLIVYTAIVLFNAAVDWPNEAIFAMMFFFVAAESYPKYQFSRKKVFLFITIIFAFAAVYFISRHIIMALG